MYSEEVSECQGQLRGFINSLHYYKHEVDDILQETNITLLKKEKDFDDSKEFLPWAFSIARFTLLAHRKKRARELNKLSFYDFLPEKADKDIRDQILYDAEMERLNLLKLVRKRLTKKQNNLLDALLEGKSISEICNECETTYSTVSTLKTRMVQKMRKILLEIKLSRKYDYSD